MLPIVMHEWPDLGVVQLPDGIHRRLVERRKVCRAQILVDLLGPLGPRDREGRSPERAGGAADAMRGTGIAWWNPAA